MQHWSTAAISACVVACTFGGAGVAGTGEGSTSTTGSVADSSEVGSGTTSVGAASSGGVPADSSSTGSPLAGTGTESTSTTGVDGSTDTGTSSGAQTTSGGPAATCRDATLNGEETDVDCGGPMCAPCDVGLSCTGDGDCLSALCDGANCFGPDLTIWLDAQASSTLFQDVACEDPVVADGDPVRCWSGPFGTATAEEGVASYEDGPPGVRFEDDVFVAPDVFAGSVDDVFILLVTREDAGANSFDFNLNHPSTGTPGRYSAHVPWNGSRRVIFDAGDTMAGRIRTGPGLVQVGGSHIFGFVNSTPADVREIFIDGSSRVQEVGATNPPAGDLGLGIGSASTFREVRIYRPAPDDAVREEIEGRVACRWDMLDQLPMTHPYYAADGASDTGCP
ncbi:MAG: hypothetical protein AAF721_25680 [Myxococcota bacterium]